MPRVFRKPGRSVFLTRFKVNGKRYELSTGERDEGAAKKEARKLQAAKIVENPPTPRLRARGRLEDVSVMDIEARSAAGRTEAAMVTLEIQWANVLAFFGPDALAADLTSERIASYIGHRRKDVLGQTIAGEVQNLKRGLGLAEQKGWISKLPTPWPKVKMDPKHATKKGRFIPPEALRAFLNELPEWLAEEMLFDVLTGLRGGGELRRVTMSWAEPAPRGFPTPAILRVPAWATKNRTERVVGLPEVALRIMQRRAKERGNDKPLFPAVQAVSIRTRAAKKVGLTIVPHRRDLRHTYATLGDYLTGDRKAVQDAMGHATPQMTGRYLHSWDARTATVAASVASALSVGSEEDQACAFSSGQAGARGSSGSNSAGSASSSQRSNRTSAPRGMPQTGSIGKSEKGSGRNARPNSRRDEDRDGGQSESSRLWSGNGRTDSVAWTAGAASPSTSSTTITAKARGSSPKSASSVARGAARPGSGERSRSATSSAGTATPPGPTRGTSGKRGRGRPGETSRPADFIDRQLLPSATAKTVESLPSPNSPDYTGIR